MSDSPETGPRVAPLISVALAGQAIGYLLSVLLARYLSLEGFEAYVIASAAFIVLATFSARGVEKYTLTHLPVLLERREWGLMKGFLRFGMRRTVTTAVVAAILLAAWSRWIREPSDAVRLALIATSLSLPAGALMYYAVEVLSALGRPLQALAIFKLLVPGLALVLIAVLMLLSVPIGGAAAIACWGAAWAAALVLMLGRIGSAMPDAAVGAHPVEEPAIWRAEARPFLVYRLALALLGQAGVIALDMLQPSAVAVGAYAAAAATAALAGVLASATNRAYGRELALRLDRQDFEGLLAARRRRLRWLGPVVILFMFVSLTFPEQILAPYGLLFAREGANAFRVLAISTAFGIVFSLAPTYLKARKRSPMTYAVVTAAGMAQLMLLWVFVPRFGAMGAALAHAFSMCGMYGAFALMAYRELTALKVPT